MIAAALADRAARHPERVLVRAAQGSLAFETARREAQKIAQALRAWAGGRIGLSGVGAEWLLPRLAALDAIRAQAYVLPPDVAASRRETAGRLGLVAVLAEGEGAPVEVRRSYKATPDAAGQLVLFSSGTTGTPKPVLHTWPNLARRVRVRPDLEGTCWMASYGMATFAGLQVLLHVLLNGGTLVVPPTDPGEAAALARHAGVTHLSGTPSFYRQLLARASHLDLGALPLRQITLGGEAADQRLLDDLAERFPAARITQIYASTEMGACLAVHDGLSGLPLQYLDEELGGVRLRIVDGELHVGSPGAMLGYLREGSADPPGEWFATGDLVEVRGHRVHFVGRRDSRLNVGGSKADPEEIEAVVRDVPGVLAARVSGAPSSLLGQLVRAEVVLDAGVDKAAVRREILARCRESLRPHMVPRLLDFVDELARTASGKLVRRRP